MKMAIPITRNVAFCISIVFGTLYGLEISLNKYGSGEEETGLRRIVANQDMVVFMSRLDYTDDPMAKFVYFQIFKPSDQEYNYLCHIDLRNQCGKGESSDMCSCTIITEHVVEINISIEASVSLNGASLRGTVIRSYDNKKFVSEEQVFPEMYDTPESLTISVILQILTVFVLTVGLVYASKWLLKKRRRKIMAIKIIVCTLFRRFLAKKMGVYTEESLLKEKLKLLDLANKIVEYNKQEKQEEESGNVLAVDVNEMLFSNPNEIRRKYFAMEEKERQIWKKKKEEIRRQCIAEENKLWKVLEVQNRKEKEKKVQWMSQILNDATVNTYVEKAMEIIKIKASKAKQRTFLEKQESEDKETPVKRKYISLSEEVVANTFKISQSTSGMLKQKLKFKQKSGKTSDADLLDRLVKILRHWADLWEKVHFKDTFYVDKDKLSFLVLYRIYMDVLNQRFSTCGSRPLWGSTDPSQWSPKKFGIYILPSVLKQQRK